MSTAWPYAFEDIPNYSRQQLLLKQGIEQYISSMPFTENFKRSFGQTIEDIFNEQHSLSPVEIKSLTTNELKTSLPDINYVAIIGTRPTHHQILLELDPRLVGLALERILGGSGAGVQSLQPLTEIEEGVLSFGLLKVLKHFHSNWNHSEHLILNFHRLTSQTNQLDATCFDSHYYCVVAFFLKLNREPMSVRLIIPQQLVANSLFTVPKSHSIKAHTHTYTRKLLASIGEQKIEARVQVANLGLNLNEIATLEIGDIIIIDSHQLTYSLDGVTGTAFVRIGQGENGELQCAILNKNGQHYLQINTIFIQEKPEALCM